MRTRVRRAGRFSRTRLARHVLPVGRRITRAQTGGLEVGARFGAALTAPSGQEYALFRLVRADPATSAKERRRAANRRARAARKRNR